MGLFSKKPKPPADDLPTPEPATRTDLPRPPDYDEMTRTEKARVEKKLAAEKSERAERTKKPKKLSIDPADFLNLRNELIDVRARLEASEQSRAIVESRLAALDATTTAMASIGGPGATMGHDDDLQARLANLELQLGDVIELAAGAASTAEQAAAQAAALATEVADAPTSEAGGAGPAATDPDVLATIEALQQKIAEVAAAQAAQAEAPPSAEPIAPTEADPEVAARLDALTERIDATPDLTAKLAQLEERLAELTAKADAPPPLMPPPMPSGPDPDTLARIDQLAAQVAVVDALSGQLSQLNARVSAQAEFGAQLTSLRDRINELQSDTDTRREAALAATGDAELRDRLNALSDRLAATESLSGQLGQLAERMSATDAANRQTVAQVAALEQRVDSVGTELANQLSELGRDIDGLAARTSEVAAGNVTDEVVDALRTGQIKLANEQARYEIAFREDLAALAEHVRRQPKS